MQLSYLIPFIFILCFGLPGAGPVCAHAGLVFFDNVTTTHTPVYMKVLTRGVLRAEGGRRVEVYAGNRPIGRILSGGDGYGFLQIVPGKAGLKVYEARMEGARDTARLLTMEKNEGAILFELEALRRHFFSKSGLGDAQKALNKLNEHFKIVYLTRLIGVSLAERIITAYDFPRSAVIDWRGKASLENLKRRHVRLDAVVGSADTVSAARGAVAGRFTFDETTDGTPVKDWQDLLRKLHPKESK